MLIDISSSSPPPEQTNIFGQLGPRCPTCSGLGSFLSLSTSGTPTRAATRCRCGGSGLDMEAIRASQMSDLINRLERAERRMDGQARLIRELRSEIKLKGKMSRQSWVECIHWLTVDGTAVHTTTSETILFPNIVIPANYMSDGRVLQLYMNGKYSTLGSGTVTHVYRVRWAGVGGTVICATGTVTLLISMTNAFFEMNVELTTRSNGATGSIIGGGKAAVFGGTAPTIGSATGAPAIAPMTAGGQTAPAPATSLDLMSDTALAVTIQHGASNAANTATGLQYSVMSKN